MKTNTVFFASFLMISGTLMTTGARAEDWPMYRGTIGDGKSPESIGAINSRDLKLVWKTPTPLGFSSISVAGGRAFTVVARPDPSGANRETLVALSTRDGSELWSLTFGSGDYEQGGGNAGDRGNSGGDGPRSTPAVDGDRVYVYDSYMALTCVDAANGRLVWQQDIIKDFQGRNIEWLNASSPVIAGDFVIIGGGGTGESFLAFEKSSGDVVWKSGDETITHATPHLATVNGSSQVIFFTQSGLVGIEVATGKELWRAKFPFSVSTAASPINDGSLVYCSAGYGVGAGLFNVTSTNKANEVWFKANELMNHWSTPVIHDGHIYGIFEFKKYGKAPLQCVELATGKIKWAERGFGPGNCILVGDKLVVLSDAGEVAIVRAKPDAFHEIARIKAVGGKCWSTPSYSAGRIYVRSTTEAACIEVATP
jgi:outer membrane protein assembly factor BamB